jgi:hypothetical protein
MIRGSGFLGEGKGTSLVTSSDARMRVVTTTHLMNNYDVYRTTMMSLIHDYVTSLIHNYAMSLIHNYY